MKKIFTTIFICLGLFLSNCGNSQSESYWQALPEPIGWVNDFEDILSEVEENSLDSIIADFEANSSVEIGIITIPEFAAETERFDELTLHIAQTWGVGKKDKNNGILIGFSKSHRRIRIQNGLGIEKYISDERTKQIIDENLLSNFKSKQFYKGLYECIEAIKLTLKDAKF